MKLFGSYVHVFSGHRFSIKSLLQLSLLSIDRDGGYHWSHSWACPN